MILGSSVHGAGFGLPESAESGQGQDGGQMLLNHVVTAGYMTIWKVASTFA